MAELIQQNQDIINYDVNKLIRVIAKQVKMTEFNIRWALHLDIKYKSYTK